MDQSFLPAGEVPAQTIIPDLRALQAALEAALAYTRIAQSTDIAETARHNYRNAQLAHSWACEALRQALTVPADLSARLSDVSAQLEALESRLA